jgi:tetratricopeptide (TPR) repeat protein
LLEALLGNGTVFRPLKRLLIERTECNPFFLEESVRTLVETGALLGERGAYRLVKSPESLQIPETAQAILAARIDRLAAEDKRLLQAASVIGKEVPITLLQAIAELPEDSLRGGLTRLKAAEFLYETLLFPDLEYTFKHAMTHEVAYGGMLHERRRALHCQIVDAIESLYPGRPEHVEQLAHHALRGEAWEKAVNYLRQAGVKAAARSALREAVTYFELALDALARLPETPETIEQAIDIRLDLQAVLYPLAGIEKTLNHLHEAESLAETSGDKLRLGRVSAHMTYCYYWMGNLEQAVAVGERARSIASALGDLGLQVSANVRLGQTYYAAGEVRRAAELFEWNIANLEGDMAQQAFGLPLLPSGLSRDRLGWCLATLGEFYAAHKTVEQGVLMAEAAGHPFTLAKLCLSAGWICIRQGRVAESLSWIERGGDIAHGERIPILTAMVAWRLGEAYALSGRFADSVALLEQASEQLAALRHTGFHPQAVTALGTAYQLSGQLVEARQSVQRALSMSRGYNQPGFEAEALRVLGDIETCQTPRDELAVAAAFGQALMLATQRGMCPLAAHCHFGLGEHYQRTGNRPKAKNHLAAARTMYRKMEMTLWLERAES